MEIDKMKEVLSNFEERMRKLENPGSQRQSDQDPAKQSEDEFISLMKEINAGGQTDQAGDRKTDEDEFISILTDMNRQTDGGQENNE